MKEATTLRHTPLGPLDDAAYQIASEVARSAVGVLGCSAVEVYVYDEAAGAYVVIASASEGGEPTNPGAPLDYGAVATALHPGRTVLAVDDARTLTGPLAAAASRLRGASLIVVRLEGGRRPLGLALCAYRAPRAFGAGDIEVASGFGKIAAAAIEYARRSEAALDRADRLATLLDSAAAFAGEIDFDSLFRAVHAQVQRHMDAPDFFVALQDAEISRLRTEYAVIDGRRVYVEGPPPEALAAAEVFASGRPLLLESGSAMTTTNGSAGSTPEAARAALIVPMCLRDRVIGVIAVQSRQPKPYAGAQVQLLLEVAEQAATAIQNAGMLREERRRTAELTTLHRLAALTNSQPQLESVLDAIVVEAATVFGADAASVALANERGQFELAASTGLVGRRRPARTIDRASFLALFGDPPRERFLGPEQIEKFGQPELVRDERIRSVYCLPLLHQGRLVGGLVLYGRERMMRLGANESRLAQLFADQAATAAQRARAAHALAERIKDYDTLSRLGHALVSKLDLDYDEILGLLHEQLGYEHVSLYALEGQPPRLVLKAYIGYPDEIKAVSFDVGRGVAGWVAQHGEMADVPDVSRDPRFVPGPLAVGSMLVYPLKIGDEVLGVLSVDSPGTNAFTPRDRRVMGTFADQCAIALSHAQQHATATKRMESLAAARSQLEQYAQYLERRQQELKLVNAVSAAANATLNLDQMLSAAVERVAEGVHAERCAVAIIDAEQTEIEIAADHRANGLQSNRGVKLPLDRHYALGYVMRDRRTLVCDDLLADPRFAPFSSFLHSWHLRSVVAVPLIAEGQVIGLLTVNSTTGPRHFTTDEIAVLETVANELALGIRNVRLYDRARERANEDSLTGLFNHRHLQERLDHELQRARRAKQPLAIAMFDLNNFKAFNDKYGHPLGDEVLRLVANTLKGCLRGTDVAGRYGGDEFLVIMPQSDEPGARLLMKRVRDRIQEEERQGFPPIPIQISVGVAVYPRDGNDKRELIAVVDEAMYSDKRSALTI